MHQRESDAHTHPNEGKSFITISDYSEEMNTNRQNANSFDDDRHFTSDHPKFSYHKKGFFDIMISKKNFNFTGNDGVNGNIQFDVPKTYKE